MGSQRVRHDWVTSLFTFTTVYLTRIQLIGVCVSLFFFFFFYCYKQCPYEWPFVYVKYKFIWRLYFWNWSCWIQSAYIVVNIDTHTSDHFLYFASDVCWRLERFLKVFIKVYLIYSVVLIAVQQVIYVFFFIFFSIMVYHRTLIIVPCAIYSRTLLFIRVERS